MLEALIYGALLGLVVSRPGVRDLARKLPLPYRVASASLVVLLVVGQLVEDGAAFPFIPWDMYTRPAPFDPVVFEYTGLTESGKELPLDLRRCRAWPAWGSP